VFTLVCEAVSQTHSSVQWARRLQGLVQGGRTHLSSVCLSWEDTDFRGEIHLSTKSAGFCGPSERWRSNKWGPGEEQRRFLLAGRGYFAPVGLEEEGSVPFSALWWLGETAGQSLWWTRSAKWTGQLEVRN